MTKGRACTPLALRYFLYFTYVKSNQFFFFTVFLLLSAPSFGQHFEPADTSFKQGDVFTTYSITWKLDKDILDSTSFPTLDSLASFMSKNPQVTLEISSHYGSRTAAHEKYRSRDLSRSRAESIRDYLIYKGIAKSRLTAVGYGAEKPLVPNEQLHNGIWGYNINRRVEFKITGMNYINIHEYSRRVDINILETDSIHKIKE